MKELDKKLIIQTLYSKVRHTPSLNGMTQKDFETYINEVEDLIPLQLLLVNDMITNAAQTAKSFQSNETIQNNNSIDFSYKFIILYMLYLNNGHNYRNILKQPEAKKKKSILDFLDMLKEKFMSMLTEEEKLEYENKSL